MKLIIKIDDDIAKGIRGENECEVEPREIVRSFQATIADAISNGKLYDDSGDLISRKDLQAKHDEFCAGDCACCTYGVDYTKSSDSKFHCLLIDNAPTVDLWQMRQEATENALKKAEVLYGRPQGEWINHRNDYGHNIADCSLCGKTMQWHDEDGDGIPRYCWYCGASMKGGAV